MQDTLRRVLFFVRERRTCLLAGAVLALVPSLLESQTAHFAGVQSNLVTSALNSPHSLSVDPKGNLIIADTFNNRLLEETPQPGGSFSETVLYSGSASLFAGTADATGNVYVADTVHNRVLKETLSGGAYTETIVGTGLSYPESVVVDASGNVYIADSENGRVLKETLSGSVFTQTVIASGSYVPTSVAVNASGNVYIADYTNSLVRLETLQGNGSYVETTISASGLSGPTGLAVDSSGNLFLVDYGNKRVLKETLSGGSYTQTILGTGSGIAQPFGVAVDAVGNVYVSDAGGNRILLESTSAGAFGSVAVAATSPAISLIFTFNTAGTLGSTPYQITTGGATGLDFGDAGAGTCTAGTAFAIGASCTVNLRFTPQASGTRYGGAWLQGSANTPIASGYVMGIGTGPQIAFLPPTQTVVASGLYNPRGMTLDPAGNLYIAETDYPQTGNFVAGRILKETFAGGTYTQSVLATSALWFPLSVAVGSSGNLYVADSWHFRIVNETWGGSSYNEKTVISSTLSYPSSVAVDASGSVYIADAGNNRIVKETLTGTNTYAQTVLAFTGLNNPQSVAVDGAGNLYVGDSGNNRIVKGTLSGTTYTQSTISTLTSLSYPTVSVDAWGNLYIADRNHNRVLKETVSGSSYVESTVGSGFNSPNYALSDGKGDVFVADTSNGRIVRVAFASPPALSFPSTYVGDTSAAQPVTLANIGNAPLNIAVPASGLNPAASPSFSLNTTSGAACPQLSPLSAATSLAAGGACLLPVSFTPASTGALSGTLTITDNALNAGSASQAIPLSGTGLAPDTTSMTLSGSPNPVTAGGNLTLRATVSDTLNTGPVPTGSVTFADTYQGTTTSLNAGSQVSLNGGVATLTYSISGVGVHTISAAYWGTNQSAAASAGTSVTATAATPALAFASIPTRTYGVAPFAVTATSASSGAVTYTVTSGPAVLLGNVLTITGAGTVVLSAVQAADGNFSSASAGTSFIVSKVAVAIVSSSSLNPSIFGDSVTLSFQFNGAGAVPTGTATLMDGASAVATLSLNAGGRVTFTPAITLAGAAAHLYTVTYVGDANYF